MKNQPEPSRFPLKASILPSESVPGDTISRLPETHEPTSRATSKTAQAEDWTGRTESFLAQPPEKPAPGASGTPASSDLAENFRHAGWMPFRRKVLEALQTTPGVSPRRVGAFGACGCDAYVESCFVTNGIQVERFRLRSTKCHDRFCVPCSNERSLRIRHSLLEHMFKRKNMSLITLTLAHSDTPLTEQLDRITKHFRALRNRPLWQAAVKGGASIIETKVGAKDGLWHVHYHVLAEAGYMDQKKLAAEWLKVTKDSQIVDIRRVGAMTGAVQYITKYVTKAADSSIVNSKKHLIESIAAFHGRRLVSTFGTWRGLELMEKPDETKNEDAGYSSWARVGSLDDVMRAAARGDSRSLRIMLIIAPKKFSTSRPIPPPSDQL